MRVGTTIRDIRVCRFIHHRHIIKVGRGEMFHDTKSILSWVGQYTHNINCHTIEIILSTCKMNILSLLLSKNLAHCIWKLSLLHQVRFTHFFCPITHKFCFQVDTCIKKIVGFISVFICIKHFQTWKSRSW